MNEGSKTLAKLRKDGYTPATVEKFVRFPPPGHRVDLYGFIDQVAMKAGVPGILGVQTCAASTAAAHVKKCMESPHLYLWKQCGNRIQVWSWSKKGAFGKRKLWECRVIEL